MVLVFIFGFSVLKFFIMLFGEFVDLIIDIIVLFGFIFIVLYVGFCVVVFVDVL